ncbi:MAG: cytochrome c biogenesis protein CcsA [candidate division Zixibacteria bacterium]|nr:cytochrome c biogenesis protein CcsA [candidate division Zixibacteria bacterium]
MITGSYILALATAAAVLSAAGYYFTARGSNKYLLVSRWSYNAATALVITAVVYLIILFLNDRFEFTYISSCSSIDLPVNFKITSLWAGQEGSFLLWAAFSVLLGLWVRLKAKEQIGWVMFFYMISLLFLFTLLNISSPFKLNAAIPPDGQGLNPLLQSFWMQIHPPIMFLGYAATFVPFAFAMAALASNKFDSWVKLTFPWAIFSVCTLGAGIFLGGYWSYETLGWGGYWGWDPVENASLVPWLANIALVHGMILERKKGTFRKTNLFLAITTFLMVIYGTFLTRSGVLADFSVHSFVDLGLNAYLAAFLIGFTVVSYGFLALRAKSINSAEPTRSPLSKEFAVFLGMLFIILSAFLVLMGTSAPLITRLFMEPSAVDISYYPLTNLPIAVILGIVLGMAGVFTWRVISWRELKHKLIVPLIAAVMIVALSALMGVYNIIHLLFIFTSAFAFIANLILMINHSQRGFNKIQADIIHIGLALMFIGIVISSGYSYGEKSSLELNESEELMGYRLTYKGIKIIDANREQAILVVERGSDSFNAPLDFIYSRQGLVRNPYIKKFLSYDLYISPEEIKTIKAADSSQTIILSKGQTKVFDGCEITFEGFAQGSHADSGMFSIGAELKVKTIDGKTETIKPIYKLSGETPELIPAALPGTNMNVYLLKISADEGAIMLGISENDIPDVFKDKQILIVEITKKPLINLVWLGLIMIVVSSGFAAYWRFKEAA